MMNLTIAGQEYQALHDILVDGPKEMRKIDKLQAPFWF